MSTASFNQFRSSFVFLSPLNGDRHLKRKNTKSFPGSTNDSGISTESEEYNGIASQENTLIRKEHKKSIHHHHSYESFITLSDKHTSHYPASVKIEDIKQGKHIDRCIRLHKRPLKYDSVTEINDNSIVYLIKSNYQRMEDGSLEMVNNEIHQKQKEATGKIAKQLGAALFTKKTISLPVSIFEPQTMLEKVALSFVYAPNFLEPAAKTMDKFEQFKLTLAFWVASLHTNVWLYKPFNPILGETFQGYVEDSPIYVEQISHHPPVCCFQMYGDRFNIQGSYETQANTSTNSLKTKNFGYPKIFYKNTNVNIMAFMPTFQVTGTLYGKKAYVLSHKLILVDFENQYYVELEFDVDISFWSKEKKLAKDAFSSSIWRVKPTFLQKLQKEIQSNKDISTKFKPKEDAIEKLDSVEGSWLTSLYIGGEKYWTFGVDVPANLKKITNALPSDSTFRPDVLHLKVNDEKTAQKYKEELEAVQRKDRKLREQKK